MEKISLINKNGLEEEFDVVLAYEDPKTKNGYLVYTKDKNNNNGDLYLASYDPSNTDNLELHDVNTQEEKDMIMNILKNIQ
jgi:uncharacterized protein YrzB (UPF0473 family)